MSHILVSFDIDGTLMLKTRSIGKKEAMKAVFQIDKNPNEIIGHSLTGYTDMEIAREIVEKLRNDHSEEEKQKLMNQYINFVGDYFYEHYDEAPMKILDGTVQILQDLSKLDNVHIAICTGNAKKIGETKLEKTNIKGYFDSDLLGIGTHLKRSDILLDLKNKCQQKYGELIRCIHIGDSILDVDNAIEAGFIPIYVNTGAQKSKNLQQPSFFVENLVAGHDEIISIVTTGKSINGEDHILPK